MTKIRKLVYASDKENAEFAGVEQLLSLRNQGLEEVIFLGSGGGGDWERRVADYGLRSRTLPGNGPIFSKVLDFARQEEISMVAVSLKKEAKGFFSGSSLRNLLRSMTVPVVIINNNTPLSGPVEKGIFYHIIYATDWSPLSDSVLEFLLNLKEITEMLEIVHVINRKLSIRELRKLKEKIVETRKIFLDRGMDAEAHIYAGKPHEEIMLAARDYNASSIIMGTSYRSSFKSFFSRSCSCRVAEETALPTLFIPSSKENKKWK